MRLSVKRAGREYVVWGGIEGRVAAFEDYSRYVHQVLNNNKLGIVELKQEVFEPSLSRNVHHIFEKSLPRLLRMAFLLCGKWRFPLARRSSSFRQ
jgi:hypothetical protein